MSKHTPGPWAIDEEDMRDDPETVFSLGIWAGPEQSVMVAHVSAFGLHSEMRDGVEHVSATDPGQSELDKAKANARLIAAAPELLEVLARYVQQDQAHGCTDNNLFRSAQDAISKATGGQQ